MRIIRVKYVLRQGGMKTLFIKGNPTWKKMPSETAKNGDTLYVWKKVE